MDKQTIRSTVISALITMVGAVGTIISAAILNKIVPNSEHIGYLWFCIAIITIIVSAIKTKGSLVAILIDTIVYSIIMMIAAIVNAKNGTDVYYTCIEIAIIFALIHSFISLIIKFIHFVLSVKCRSIQEKEQGNPNWLQNETKELTSWITISIIKPSIIAGLIGYICRVFIPAIIFADIAGGRWTADLTGNEGSTVMIIASIIAIIIDSKFKFNVNNITLGLIVESVLIWIWPFDGIYGIGIWGISLDGATASFYREDLWMSILFYIAFIAILQLIIYSIVKLILFICKVIKLKALK